MAKKNKSSQELPAEFKRFNELVEYVRSKEMEKTNGVHVPDVKIAEMTGYNPSAFSMMKNNKDKKVSSFMPKAAKNLCEHYPECNLEYVLNGTGSLLKETSEVLIIEEEEDIHDVNTHTDAEEIFCPKVLMIDEQENKDEPESQEEDVSQMQDCGKYQPLTAREKWELAAAEYGLSYDPDDMMARDAEGKIHLFVEEEGAYVQKIYAKGIKIRELNSAVPERSIYYHPDKRVFAVEKQFTIDIKSDVMAYSEAEARKILETAIQEEVARMKNQLESITINEE